MKKIMILGASILQLPAIKCAKKMGLYVVAVDMNAAAIGFGYADACELISTVDTEQILSAARKHNIAGIMTLASDMPMLSVARVAAELSLQAISVQCAERVTNKGKMRDCLLQAKVPIPAYYQVESAAEYLAAVSRFRDKCLIKPVDNSGSRGVFLLTDFTPQAALAAYEYSRAHSKSGLVLVEEFMQGPEVSVETFSIGGCCEIIQITDKLTSGAPYFVELGHSQPSMLSASVQQDIRDVAARAVQAVGIVDGPAHVEIIVTSAGAKIVELEARLGGDNITTALVPLSTGIDLVELTIKTALGDPVYPVRKYNKAAAIRYFTAPNGWLEKISGCEEAAAIPGVQQLLFTKQVGDAVGSVQSSNDRLGFVITQADSPQAAIDICKQVCQAVRIDVKEAK